MTANLNTEDAVDRVPFENGSAGADWFYNWCDRCVNDVNEDCPLVAIAYGGFTPCQWVDENVESIRNRYRCTEFEARA